MFMRHWLFYLITTLCILGCTQEKILPTTVETISSHQLKTRIVIQNFPLNQTACISIDEIAKDLAHTELLFGNLNIKFSIEKIERWDFNQSLSIDEIKKDAKLHPDHLSIYYITILSDANRYFDFDTKSIGFLSGLSAFPWENNPYGVILFPQCYSPYTLAHELGHYFGLYHTFEPFGDKVDDTKEGTDPQYNNFMNYTVNYPLTITQGQIDRMRYFLLGPRKNILK